MMDLKEIIKWFIPCFHILQLNSKKMRACLILFCLFLNSYADAKDAGGSGKLKTVENSEKFVESTKNLGLGVNSYVNSLSLNQSGGEEDVSRSRSYKNTDSSVGRTFGRPFKKMMAGLLPIVFQIGAASTWAVVAAIVGFKTLLVTLVILKILLLAGAAKFGALFASKSHAHAHGWEHGHSQQKEIHLHIHNNGHGHHEETHDLPYSGWSREGTEVIPAAPAAPAADRNIKVVVEPYPSGGPATISTPFGNYVKIDSAASNIGK